VSGDLAAFVAARLDEDEAAAKANIGIGHGWQTGLGDSEDGGPNWPDYQTYDSDELKAANDYLDRFRPLRMLREVEAKRAIVAEHAEIGRNSKDGPICNACVNIGADPMSDDFYVPYPCKTVRHLAAVWSGHPDYKPEWAP